MVRMDTSSSAAKASAAIRPRAWSSNKIEKTDCRAAAKKS